MNKFVLINEFVLKTMFVEKYLVITLLMNKFVDILVLQEIKCK